MWLVKAAWFLLSLPHSSHLTGLISSDCKCLVNLVEFVYPCPHSLQEKVMVRQGYRGGVLSLGKGGPSGLAPQRPLSGRPPFERVAERTCLWLVKLCLTSSRTVMKGTDLITHCNALTKWQKLLWKHTAYIVQTWHVENMYIENVTCSQIFTSINMSISLIVFESKKIS